MNSFTCGKVGPNMMTSSCLTITFTFSMQNNIAVGLAHTYIHIVLSRIQMGTLKFNFFGDKHINDIYTIYNCTEDKIND